jgi:hypothetical protein
MHLHHLQAVLSFCFGNLQSRSTRLPEDDAYAPKHEGVLTIYSIKYCLYKYIYICVCVCVCVCVCCAFVGLGNKLYNTHGTDMEIAFILFY